MAAGPADVRAALAGAHRDRALIYRAIDHALRARLGEAGAAEAMREALRARGRDIGKSLRAFAPKDLAGFARAFTFDPPDSELWDASIERCEGDALDLTMRRCPLKEAWQAAGADDAEVARLCHIAAALDEGTFEAAGFDWSIETWSKGIEGCCRLHVRAKG
jgi:hypothetical protein